MNLRPAAVALACLVVAAPSAAAKPLRTIAGTEVTFDRDLPLAVHSDASRWYAYQEHRGVVVAVDTRTHSRRSIHEPGRCSLEDLRFARILLDCRTDPVARLVKLPSGAPTDFTDVDPGSGDPFPDELFALGRYWLGGFTCDPELRCAEAYLNRRTMERRIISPEDNGNPNALQADVDSPNLELRNTSRLVDVRSGGYRLTQGEDPTDPLVLTHDGRRRRLSACAITCIHATLGGGLATWYDGKLRAYSLRLQKTYSWSLPDDGTVSAVVHTASTILVETIQSGASSNTLHERLYAAGVPRR
jgi:hypothetical protein